MITLEDITKKAKLLAEEAKEEVLSKCDGRSLVDFCSYIEKYSIKIGEWIMEETQKDSNTLIGKVDNDGEIEFHQIPFDINKAQNGADVVTKGGHKVTIYDYKYKERCTERIYIAGKIEDQNGDIISFWDKDGIKVDTEERIFDLNIIEEVKYEDMWLKREIINYLKEKGDFRSCWIAWLEKQGDKNPTWSEEDLNNLDNIIWPCDNCKKH